MNILSETIKVNSKAIKKAKYNYDLSLLKLTFANGSKYNYYNVPKNKFISMKHSASVGSFINNFILKQYFNDKS